MPALAGVEPGLCYWFGSIWTRPSDSGDYKGTTHVPGLAVDASPIPRRLARRRRACRRACRRAFTTSYKDPEAIELGVSYTDYLNVSFHRVIRYVSRSVWRSSPDVVMCVGAIID